MQSNEVQRNACALRLKACQRQAWQQVPIQLNPIFSYLLHFRMGWLRQDDDDNDWEDGVRRTAY